MLALLLWVLLWGLGGWLIIEALFPLPRFQRAFSALALGLTLQVWLANLFAHFLAPLAAFWAGAISLFLLGMGLHLSSGFRRLEWRSWWMPKQWLAFFLLGWVFFGIERGLNIFDDPQNLPTLSLMAAGDIPPHFPYDPALRYGYHYFLILLAAQFMRLADLFPWTALDLARALSLSLGIMLVYLWVRRFTHSRMAGILGSIFFAFASGTRWLLLLFPPSLVKAISRHITLIGSAAQTAPDLARALLSAWRIEGDGPLPFPFAYLNGLNTAFIMSHGGIGGTSILVPLLFLLLHRRATGRPQALILAALFAAWALTTEYPLLLFVPGLLLAGFLFSGLRHGRKVPSSFWLWVWVVFLAIPFIALQGGVLTEIGRDLWTRLLRGATERTSFHTFNFSLTLPTAVSGHLGFLPLFQAIPLLVFLFEFGPMLLALPLLLIWGIKMGRIGRWVEAVFAASFLLLGTIPLFVKYSGTAGPSANARLLAGWTLPLSLYAFPLVWIWGRGRSEQWRNLLILLGMLTVFGGAVLFGIELIATQRPRLPEYLRELDARVAKAYWNRLPQDAVIFDPLPPRAPTIFARPTNAFVDWRPKPEWAVWVSEPDPYRLRQAGFTHLYFDMAYWESLSPQWQAALEQSCVKKVGEWSGYRSPTDFRKDFRRLLDIRACQ
ncbi:MAG: hypothetical protein ACK8QZ_00725 [Anaerolineales bacterium]